MLNKTITYVLTILIVLNMAASAVLAESGPFILKNNTSYKIKYRQAKANDKRTNIPEFFLEAGWDKRLHDRDGAYSFKREGTGSSWISSWYDIDKESLLAKITDYNKSEEFKKKWANDKEIPIIIVEPSYTGWDLKLDWQK